MFISVLGDSFFSSFHSLSSSCRVGGGVIAWSVLVFFGPFFFIFRGLRTARNRVSAKIRGIFAPRGCVNPSSLSPPLSSFLFSLSPSPPLTGVTWPLRATNRPLCPFVLKHIPGGKIMHFLSFLLFQLKCARNTFELTQPLSDPRETNPGISKVRMRE